MIVVAAVAPEVGPSMVRTTAVLHLYREARMMGDDDDDDDTDYRIQMANEATLAWAWRRARVAAAVATLLLLLLEIQENAAADKVVLVLLLLVVENTLPRLVQNEHGPRLSPLSKVPTSCHDHNIHHDHYHYFRRRHHHHDHVREGVTNTKLVWLPPNQCLPARVNSKW